MNEYHKIQSIFKRDEKTHKFIEGEWAKPEFDYLKNNIWIYTEKIDGTNVRVMWLPDENGEFQLRYGGRTDNAQMPIFLLAKLQQLFDNVDWAGKFNDGIVLYGEGYGAKIQKGGGNYISDGVNFALFDVKIGDWWLKREDVDAIAQTLNIKTVPIVGSGTIDGAIFEVSNGFTSTFGNFTAEGVVLRPQVELKDRAGHRVITKLKHKDFN